MPRRLPNQSNRAGQAFQKRVELGFVALRRAGRATIEKIDPPVRVVGTGQFRRVIFLENPWLDYGGVWTEAGGRAMQIEAKSTEQPRLPVGRPGGLTAQQTANLIGWHRRGVACAVLWGHGDETRILTAEEIESAVDAGAASIRWRHVPAVPRGTGGLEFDWLAELARRIGQI